MRFILDLFPDVAEDTPPAELLRFAIESIEANPELRWEIRKDDGTLIADNVVRDLTLPTEAQRSTCRHCGKAIIWYFDRDEDAEPTRYGWWYDAETMLEGCFADRPDDEDEDLWHEPEEG